jgi:5-methylcytosine-specific restriction endonuclease McrA
MSKIEAFLIRWVNDVEPVFDCDPAFLSAAAIEFQSHREKYRELSSRAKHEQFLSTAEKKANRRKSLSKKRMLQIFRRDKFTCQICQTGGGDLTIDHIKPVSKGGGNEVSNLRTACRKCNVKRGCNDE